MKKKNTSSVCTTFQALFWWTVEKSVNFWLFQRHMGWCTDWSHFERVFTDKRFVHSFQLMWYCYKWVLDKLRNLEIRQQKLTPQNTCNQKRLSVGLLKLDGIYSCIESKMDSLVHHGLNSFCPRKCRTALEMKAKKYNAKTTEKTPWLHYVKTNISRNCTYKGQTKNFFIHCSQ